MARTEDQADKPWDVRIFEQVPPGVDETLIAERLKMTPTERVESMLQALLFAEEARKALHGNRLP